MCFTFSVSKIMMVMMSRDNEFWIVGLIKQPRIDLMKF